jgi:hypothetical protein
VQSYQIEDIGDLARLTRASRLLYYITIPRLYEKVTLKAYPELRYVGDVPEGFGGGSPFAAGLDSLIGSSNDVAQYVKYLRVCGEWKELDRGQFEKGRVPDNSMVLNIAFKAAIVRAKSLQEFM